MLSGGFQDIRQTILDDARQEHRAARRQRSFHLAEKAHDDVGDDIRNDEIRRARNAL